MTLNLQTQFVKLHPFEIAVVGFVYAVLLTDQEQILHGVKHWLHTKLMKKTAYAELHCIEHGSEAWYKIKCKDYEWIYKPLIGCDRCVTGQFALWLYVVTCSHYCFIDHLCYVCFAIFWNAVINIIYQRFNR